MSLAYETQIYVQMYRGSCTQRCVEIRAKHLVIRARSEDAHWSGVKNLSWGSIQRSPVSWERLITELLRQNMRVFYIQEYIHLFHFGLSWGNRGSDFTCRLHYQLFWVTDASGDASWRPCCVALVQARDVTQDRGHAYEICHVGYFVRTHFDKSFLKDNFCTVLFASLFNKQAFALFFYFYLFFLP